MGFGKSNLLGHIERLMIPRLRSGSLSFYAIDPKGDLLMYLSDYKEIQLFDSQRGMVGWRPLSRKTWIPLERQATWFVDSFKSAWGDDIETARLENHVFNSVVPVLVNNGTMLDVVDVLFGKRFPLPDKFSQMSLNIGKISINRVRAIKLLCTESARNRLGRFVQDPLVRELCKSEPAWIARNFSRRDVICLIVYRTGSR